MLKPILSVRDLKTVFPSSIGDVIAVNGVSFELNRGQVLGIVGESGAGKSAIALSIVRLISPPGNVSAGEILFEGQDLLRLSERDMRGFRGGQIGMIFQNPMSSLNPYLRISDQISESIRLHLGLSAGDAHERAIEMLDMVGIPDARYRARRYSHEMSGGMRQRTMIAMALACRPKLLIADEPTTALDVTIQAQILDLLRRVRRDSQLSMLFVTHDLGVLAGIADQAVVMYAGRVFESAPTRDLLRGPQNPYTRALFRSVPSRSKRGTKLFQIPGLPPDLAHHQDGCPFAPRCGEAFAKCFREAPPLRKLSAVHQSLCWLE